MALKLDSPIEYIKGVGPQRGKLLRDALGITVVEELINYYPFRYIDKTKFTLIDDAKQDSQFYQIKGRLIHLEEKGFGRAKRLIGEFEDESGTIELIWFQNYQWILDKAVLQIPYTLFGRLKLTGYQKSMAHPEINFGTEQSQQALRWEPVYPSTEKLAQRGFDSRGFRKIMFQVFQNINPHVIDETLPAYILDKFKLPSRADCLVNIHFPKDEQSLARTRQRLKFEELFLMQLRMLQNMYLRKKKSRGYPMDQLLFPYKEFFEQHLPFALTAAQLKVFNEIKADLISGVQMNRLMQGDVGSGKTIVALLAMLWAISNGYQTCIMAPTEVLAMQHFQSLSELLLPIQINCALLTSNIKGTERNQILKTLESGDLKILIGTHALIEESVRFQKLGLVVIDEQHRFGVEQRAKLWNKAKPLLPHVLVMTATPIPRTLAMSLYGDLDVSVIDQLPPNRKPIRTLHFTEALRGKLYEFMKKQIAEGRQVYIVFPLIEESEKLDIENLDMGYEKLLEYFPIPPYQISVVHGRLRPKDKESEMQRFVKGTTHIMVATTVIEVGVNVPNASIMVIENAERFGLSQLHQLRGRVGRGADQSYCVLMSSNHLSKDATERIRTMCQTQDGFLIAEADLRLRGPGDLDGTRQSGLLELKIADIVEDQPILYAARKLAEAIIRKDPELKHPLNVLLKHRLNDHTTENPGVIA
ncbi:MAG: ATP-dependent DNA helicase RecG [Saprospiraceae bacterium]|nr:ATP-dependent DNA helicase RecG [Saprospiraceae bacterium]